jgi:5-(carboxyamino)imidazole ribonucleotide synthase
VVRAAKDIDAAWAAIGGGGLIYEKFQAFSREVSLIAARSAAGRSVFYPLSANTHGGGILRYSIAPYASPKLERQARIYMQRLLKSLSYVGVLAVEFFVVGGQLVANEMAPRVHNSGHWTIEGCVNDQFLGRDAGPRAAFGPRWLGVPRLRQGSTPRAQTWPLHHSQKPGNGAQFGA